MADKSDSSAASAQNAGVKSFFRFLQGVSGIAFGLFLCLHFATSISATFGADVYDETLIKLRGIYQQPIAELSLFVSLAVHLVAGGYLHWKRDKFGFGKKLPAPWYATVQRWSGSALGTLVFVHLAGTRIPSYLGQNRLDDFGHLHTMLRLAPEFGFSYFSLYAALGLAHMALGLPQILESLRVLPVGSHRKLATSPLVWLLIIAVYSAILSGMWGMHSFPASKAAIEYWKPHILANVPAMFVTGTV